jgi:hypothetical protein
MREIRLSGSEGGARFKPWSLPLCAPERALGQSGASPLLCGEESWGIEPSLRRREAGWGATERERPVRNAGFRCGSRGELDSVGVDGRAFERRAKPVKRARGEKPKRRTAGRSPVVALMVGDRMVGRSSEVIRETRRGQAVFMAEEKKMARRAARRESERP